MNKTIILIFLALLLTATSLTFAQDDNIRMGEFIEIDGQWSIMVTGASFATSLRASDNTSRYNAPPGTQFLLVEVTLWNRNHPDEETSISTGSFASTVTGANGETSPKLGHGSSTYCIVTPSKVCSSTTTTPNDRILLDWVFIVESDAAPYILDIEDGAIIGFTTAVIRPDAMPFPQTPITRDTASELTVLASFYNFGADPIQYVSINASGTHFSASTWMTTRVWNMESNEEEAIVAGSGVVFSPTNPALLALRGAENSVQLWHMDTQESETLGSYGTRIYGLTFSNDGSLLVASGCDAEVSFNCSEPVVRIYSVADASEFVTLKAYFGYLSPDNQYVAYLDEEAMSIGIYDFASDAPLNEVTLASDTVRGMAWNPQSELFAFADGATVKILDMASGNVESIVRRVYDEIAEVTFISDSEVVISGCLDKVTQWQCDASDMRVYDVAGDNIATWETSQTSGIINLTPSGDLLLGYGFNQAWLWDFDGNFIADLSHSTFAFHPANTLIVSSGSDRIVRVWGLP